MTLREIAEEAIKQGHQVKYRNRKDGGVIIQYLNGVKYTEGKGNKALRRLMGESAKLSANRKRQLKSITPLSPQARKERRAGYPKKKDIFEDEKLKSLFKESQKAWRRNKAKGRFTMKGAREYAKKYGVDELRKSLEKKLKYSQGYAYEANIDIFIERLSNFQGQVLSDKISDKIDELISLLEANKSNIKESVLEDIINEMYAIEQLNKDYKNYNALLSRHINKITKMIQYNL